jgi:hypothetical protein
MYRLSVEWQMQQSPEVLMPPLLENDLKKLQVRICNG